MALWKRSFRLFFNCEIYNKTLHMAIRMKHVRIFFKKKKVRHFFCLTKFYKNKIRKCTKHIRSTGILIYYNNSKKKYILLSCHNSFIFFYHQK